MGILAKVSPSQPNSDTFVYKVGAAKRAVFNLNVVNRSLEEAFVHLAILKDLDLSVGSIGMTNKGSGLTAIPSLTITGDNTTLATAVVKSLALSSMAINGPGQNYLVGDKITLAVTGGVHTTPAVITVESISVTGGITSFSVFNAGAYTTPGAVATVASTTSAAGSAVTFNSLIYGINEITIVNKGNGYEVMPSVQSSAGSGFVFNVQMTQVVEENDYFEYNTPIAMTDVLERTGISLSAGESLFIKSSHANAVNIHVWGFEKLL